MAVSLSLCELCCYFCVFSVDVSWWLDCGSLGTGYSRYTHLCSYIKLSTSSFARQYRNQSSCSVGCETYCLGKYLFFFSLSLSITRLHCHSYSGLVAHLYGMNTRLPLTVDIEWSSSVVTISLFQSPTIPSQHWAAKTKHWNGLKVYKNAFNGTNVEDKNRSHCPWVHRTTGRKGLFPSLSLFVCHSFSPLFSCEYIAFIVVDIYYILTIISIKCCFKNQ